MIDLRTANRHFIQIIAGTFLLQACGASLSVKSRLTGKSDPADEPAPVEPSAPDPVFSFNPNRPDMDCSPVSVSGLQSDTALTLTSDHDGKFFSDAACKEPIESSVTGDLMPDEEGRPHFFFRGLFIGEETVSVAIPGGVTKSLVFKTTPIAAGRWENCSPYEEGSEKHLLILTATDVSGRTERFGGPGCTGDKHFDFNFAGLAVWGKESIIEGAREYDIRIKQFDVVPGNDYFADIFADSLCPGSTFSPGQPTSLLNHSNCDFGKGKISLKSGDLAKDLAHVSGSTLTGGGVNLESPEVRPATLSTLPENIYEKIAD